MSSHSVASLGAIDRGELQSEGGSDADEECEEDGDSAAASASQVLLLELGSPRSRPRLEEDGAGCLSTTLRWRREVDLFAPGHISHVLIASGFIMGKCSSSSDRCASTCRSMSASKAIEVQSMGKAKMASRLTSPRMTEASSACDRCRAMFCWLAVVRRTPDHGEQGQSWCWRYCLQTPSSCWFCWKTTTKK
ncbi:hypothetical protein FA10DRAFT_51493 [Acaromyces ingoldii]|uniref:Uncharacterized protein n=1 Tax=Acaromyces ingoldii TaxID=215250 RepID=A0A316YBS9_9BASI|nr:hypothetical protein FA10DRAFT_51493 [Acaromyces ingoldii]PWN86701.1 hypothetical protein FA10DRAFT_51493 [Acaromyces ingoldii]